MVSHPARTQSESREDRGQLILIAAILLSVVVVSSVLLLNTAQSPTELRTSQQFQSITDAEQTSQEVRDGLETLFETNASLAEADAKLPYSLGLEPGVETVQESYLNHSTTNATAVTTVTYDEADTVTGGIVFQTERGTFTSADSTSTWTVLQDVTSVPKLSAEIRSLSGDFTIELGSSEALTVTSSGGGSGFTVSQTQGGSTTQCSGLELPIVIDFEGGAGEIRSPGTDCEDLTFGTTLSGEFDIEFENGDNAEGTYIVSGGGEAEVADDDDVNIYDRPTDAFPTSDEPNYRGPDDSSPTADDVVVNPAFVVTYDDPDIAYRSEYGLYNRTGR